MQPFYFRREKRCKVVQAECICKNRLQINVNAAGAASRVCETVLFKPSLTGWLKHNSISSMI